MARFTHQLPATRCPKRLVDALALAEQASGLSQSEIVRRAMEVELADELAVIDGRAAPSPDEPAAKPDSALDALPASVRELIVGR